MDIKKILKGAREAIDTLQKIAFAAFLISSCASFIFHYYIVGIISTAAFLLLGLLIYTHLKYQRYPFSILSDTITLDIKDSAGHLAHYEKQQKLRANHNGVTSYIEHGITTDGQTTNFQTNPGQVLPPFLIGGVTHVETRFSTPPQKGKPFLRHFSYDFIDSFTKSTEFYEFRTDYPVKKVFITIIFPSTRRCLSATVYHIVGVAQMKIADLPVIPLSGGSGQVNITWEKKSPSLSHRYKIEWNW